MQGLGWPIVAAVLCAALLHASWNALVKSSSDKAGDTALLNTAGAVLSLTGVLWFGLPQRESWPFICTSALIHIGYYTALANAYKNGELGMTYPIMRGFAPLLVALGSSAVIGEAPSAAAWLGIVGITLGVALVGLAHPGRALHHRKALGWAFANAAIIACYTFVDGLGVRAEARAGGETLRYVLMLSVLDGPPFALLVWLQRKREQRRELLAYAQRRWPLAAGGAIASMASYTIALWAMTRAPVASVAALRETSVLFAALLGTWLLKERFGKQRALGTVIVVIGVMALRLG